MIDLRATSVRCWQALRRLTGDDAYERYLEHWRSTHAHEFIPIDRATFYREEVQRRWNGTRRCC